MAKKLLILNVILLAIVLVLGWILIDGWHSFVEEQQIAGLKTDGSAAAQTALDMASFGLDPSQDIGPLAEVVQRNLFSPERRPPSDDSDEANDQPPPLKEPILHGTVLLGGERRANITKFEGRGKQGTQVEIRLGDMIDAYEVTKISSNSIVLSWNDFEQEIFKSAAPPPQPKRQVASAGGGVNIITIGSRGAAVETVAAAEPNQEAQGGALKVSSVGTSVNQQTAGRPRNRNSRATSGNRRPTTRPTQRPPRRNRPNN